MSTVTVGPHLVKAVFNGINGTGNVSISGLLTGDVVLHIWPSGNNYATQSNGSFYGWVYTDGQLQQVASSDLSGTTYEALLVRW